MNKMILTAMTVSLLCSSISVCAKRKLTIEQMFELADKKSKQIKSFTIAYEESLQNIKVAKNALLPWLETSRSVGYLGDVWLADRDFSNGMNAHMPHFGNNFAIEASQVLYAGGAITAAITMAELKSQIAYLDIEANRQDVRFLLVGNYLELYKINNQLKVYDQNIERTKLLLSEMRAKENQGLILPNDIIRYELQLQTLELAVIQLNNSKEIINNQLITILGLSNDEEIEIDHSVTQNMPLINSEEYWQNMAKEISPIIKIAETSVRLSKENERIIKSENLPSLALFAGDKLDGPIIIEVPPINKNLNYWYVGVGIKYKISSIYKTNKKISSARLKTYHSIEDKQFLEDNIQTSVNAAFIRYEESFRVLSTRIKSLELATQNYKVVNQRYLNDLAVLTDMLDASNSMLNADLQVVNARINILFHYYQLRKRVGNL